MTLRISESFTLPDDAQTQTFAILAKRGVGKTYTASVLAEEMAERKMRFVVLDPVGVWWGLRSSASGKRQGYPIIVLGGDHGDAPLESTAGEVIADLVVEEGATLVLDLSLFRKGEQRRFVTDFSERLYLRNRKPVHLFLDEADSFAPQSPGPDERRMLGSMEDLVRRGRARGIGVTLITQRAAVLNKSVLTQIEVLVAMRTVGPHDRKAIESWIEVHGEPEQQETLLASLPSLKIGEAWVWSPGWLRCFERVKIRQRRTFDSSATPEVGVERETARMAEIDLGALKERMAATIERAKANDPKALRAEVERLRKEVAAKPAAAPPGKPEVVEVPILTAQDRVRLTGIQEWMKTLSARWKDVQDKLKADEGLLREIEKRMGMIESSVSERRPQSPHWPAPAPSARPAAPPQRPPRAATVTPGVSSDVLSPARRRVLDAIAFLNSLGIEAPDKNMIALFAQKSPTSGGYFNDLGNLRSSGFIVYPQDGRASLTADGFKLADASSAPQTRAALHDHVRRLVGEARWKVLEVLIRAYPKAVQKDDLATQAGKSPTSGGYFNDLGSMRSSGLIDYPEKGAARAADVLFPAGLN